MHLHDSANMAVPDSPSNTFRIHVYIQSERVSHGPKLHAKSRCSESLLLDDRAYNVKSCRSLI